MNIRIPRRWRELKPGDMILSKAPFHRLVKYQDAGESDGFRFRLEPHDLGYIVTCVSRPGCDSEDEVA